jgi:AAA15 family ATPase/GTPase|tara:strand:+ start:26447 stop:27646 length:1200 start_codon:yes stop_codon:yes gene_type:complete
MITDLIFSNFYSFAEETYLSFEMGKKPARTSYDVNLMNDERLNKVAAVIGPNGAGKTQFIKPLAFLSWFISSSFLETEPDTKLPLRPHALHSDAPSVFIMRFMIGNEHYKYTLTIKDQLIVSESLFHKTSHLYSYIFVREFNENTDGSVTAEFKQQNFSFMPKKAKEIRRNASLLAAAYNYDVPEAHDFIKFAQGIHHNLNVFGRHNYDDGALLNAADILSDNEDLLARLSDCLSQLDLGLSGIRVKQEQFLFESGEEKTLSIPYGLHQSDRGEFELRLMEESSGTKSAFVLLTRLLPVLENGGIAVIDEIDNDLHPHMLPHILDLFKFKSTNPHDAQIIFSCHTSEILNLLQKHQLYLVEKDNLESIAWRLDDVIGLRVDDNLYAKYMAGALDAVPNL